MDRQIDRRPGKNNMSPDPEGGRHNEQSNLPLFALCIFILLRDSSSVRGYIYSYYLSFIPGNLHGAGSAVAQW